eukprot:4974598-Lingulodinium_polyedra.AAC.1
MKAEEQDEKKVREATRNTFWAVCHVLSMDGLQNLSRTIVLFVGPFFDAHSQHAAQVRSPSECLQ